MMTKSKIAYAVCIAVLAYANFIFYPKWQKSHSEATLSWDVCGYYFYLPSLFIYKDIKTVASQDSIHRKYRAQGEVPYAARIAPSGNAVMKYSAGMAIMYAPAFFVAHGLAQPLGYEADGFTLPYQFAIAFWSMLWAFVGLWYLRKVLLRLAYTEGVTAAVLLLYTLTTNYLDYAGITNAMPHNYIFTLYAILLWFTIQFYESPTYGSALAIGKCIGLAVLARPTELPIFLVPVFWAVYNKETLFGRVAFIQKHLKYYALAAMIVAAFGAIQFLYWKWLSGHFFYKSYGKEDWMEWFSPYILDGLFSARRGWLVYTPIMLFSLVGFYPLYRTRRAHFWLAFLFTGLFIYISFAHNIWWYGGSLGQRQMIQLMPILALPFAAFLTTVAKARWRQILFGLAVAICGYLNFWHIYQAHGGGLWRDELSPAYMRRTLGRWSVPPEVVKLLDNKYDLPKDLSGYRDIATVVEVAALDSIDARREYTEAVKISSLSRKSSPVHKESFGLDSIKGKKWLRATATFRTTQNEPVEWAMGQWIILFKKGDQIVRSNMLRPQRLMTHQETKRIWLDAKIPKKDFDTVLIYLWNAGTKQTFYIADLKVICFNE